MEHIKKYLKMETKIKMECLKITAKPYDFVGKKGDQVKGVSYKATLISPEGEIFVMKTDESVYKDVGGEVAKTGEAIIIISTNEIDGRVQLFLKQFNYQ